MTIKLVRQWTRDHGLLYAAVSEESDSKLIVELWGHTIHNFVWVKEANQQKIVCFNDEKELDGIYKWVINQVLTNPKFIPLVKKRFNEGLEKIKPYLSGKKVSSFKEAEEYHHSLLSFWPAMDSVFLIPDFEGIPKEVHLDLLAIRKQTQHYAEKLEKPLVDFIDANLNKYNQVSDVLLPSEIFSLEKKSFSEEEFASILARKDGCALFRGKIYLSSELENALKKAGLVLASENHSKIKELSGMCACKGKVTGRVVLVLNKTDSSKITQNSIVVTEMTSPAIVPMLSKASAIVTDEGGTACHAAIIAREFNKPCVVGTKHATKVLKNGDLVEVDATNGIVKLL